MLFWPVFGNFGCPVETLVTLKGIAKKREKIQPNNFKKFKKIQKNLKEIIKKKQKKI